MLKTTAALGSLGVVSAATSASGAATAQDGSVPDGKEFDNLVGAYYYGWYVPEQGRHWDTDLDTPDGRSHTPVLGEYSSHDQAVVDQHIRWALNHGINWFNCTWWGPGGIEEKTIVDYLLESQHADKMHFSLLYEPLGRDLGGWKDFGDSEVRQRLREDFQHIEDTFFGDPNWLHIDGRPVVYFWINRMFTGDVTAAFNDAISTLNTEPYIIGCNLTHAEPFDAVANFATVDGGTSDWDTYIDNSRDRRVHRKKAAEYGTDQTYIPSVQPGASWPDPILDHDADRFREACQIMAEAMDPDIRAAIVTSFNEWHEGSTLEPAEEYGTSALEVVEDELQGASVTGDFLDREYATVRFEFSDAVRPADVSDSDDIRPLCFYLNEVRLEAADGSEIFSDQHTSANDAEYQVNPAITGRSGYWLGSPLGVGSLVFERSDLEDAETLVLRGWSLDSLDDLEADVFVNGKDMGAHDLGSSHQDYRFPIPDDIPDGGGGGDDGGTEEGIHVIDDSSVNAVWKPDFDVNWPDYVYLGSSINGDPREWQVMDEANDNVFETTLGGLSAGDELEYQFAYYDDGWQYTAQNTYTHQPDDGSDGGDSGAGTNKLVYGETNTLLPGEHLESATGDYRLYFQGTDGNLVLRETGTGDALWASGTAGDAGTELKLQGDGNLVVYTDGGDPVWASNTAGSGTEELVLEDDGALVLYDGGSETWSVNE